MARNGSLAILTLELRDRKGIAAAGAMNGKLWCHKLKLINININFINANLNKINFSLKLFCDKAKKNIPKRNIFKGNIC